MKATIAALTLLAVACAPATPAKPSPPADAPHDPALIARFTNVIWPTIITYRHYGNGDPQNPPGPDSGKAKFAAVVDAGSATGGVDIKAQHIGEVLDSKGQLAGESEHISLANATISSLNAVDADIIACYTYDFTASTPYPHTDEHAVPGASEVTFTLHKGDDWLVRSISNDHVVPNCPTNKGLSLAPLSSGGQS